MKKLDISSIKPKLAYIAPPYISLLINEKPFSGPCLGSVQVSIGDVINVMAPPATYANYFDILSKYREAMSGLVKWGDGKKVIASFRVISRSQAYSAACIARFVYENVTVASSVEELLEYDVNPFEALILSMLMFGGGHSFEQRAIPEDQFTRWALLLATGELANSDNKGRVFLNFLPDILRICRYKNMQKGTYIYNYKLVLKSLTEFDPQSEKEHLLGAGFLDGRVVLSTLLKDSPQLAPISSLAEKPVSLGIIGVE